jgi:hypothetical protein
MSDIDPTDLAQERRREELAEAAKLHVDRQEAEDWHWLMSSSRGRRIMSSIRAMCGTDTSSFTGNSTTFYLEGRRSVALDLDALMKRHAPDDFISLLKDTVK